MKKLKMHIEDADGYFKVVDDDGNVHHTQSYKPTSKKLTKILVEAWILGYYYAFI